MKRLISKYKIAKFYLKLKLKLIKKFDKVEKIDLIQARAIDLYSLYLKDKESYISCSFISRKRHIQKDQVLIILNPGSQNGILTVIDENQETSINCYEVSIPMKLYTGMTLDFDKEMEKRLRCAENSKKEAISNDLDKLIKEALKNKPKYARFTGLSTISKK